MAKEVTFQLDPQGGRDILTGMAMPVVQQSANAIAARATNMASSISSDPPEISVTSQVGTIKRGTRAIATVRAQGQDSHQNYIGHLAIAKAKDAGRVN